MQLVTKGIVLREVKTGEADRILTILTEKLGIISASAKNSLRIKSKLLTSTALFCYSEFTLFEGKSMYIIDDAEPQKIFYGINNSVEGLSLAMYLAELSLAVLPPQEANLQMLQLLLNSYYCISEKKYDLLLIKAAFELRCISIAGFMPDLIACKQCEGFEDKLFYFDLINGDIMCSECTQKAGMQCNINIGTLAAMRHIIYSDAKKIFSFSISENLLPQLFYICENYTLTQIERPLKTLEFLKTMLT